MENNELFIIMIPVSLTPFLPNSHYKIRQTPYKELKESVTLTSNWKTEVFQCLIVMLITYHSWKHNSCCNNISKPCNRQGANTVQLQSHCAKNGEKNIIEVLFAHF